MFQLEKGCSFFSPPFFFWNLGIGVGGVGSNFTTYSGVGYGIDLRLPQRFTLFDEKEPWKMFLGAINLLGLVGTNGGTWEFINLRVVNYVFKVFGALYF